MSDNISIQKQFGSHIYYDTAKSLEVNAYAEQTTFTYKFQNFFHPFVGDLIEKLNKGSLADMLDPTFLAGKATEFFDSFYTPQPTDYVGFEEFPIKEIDVSNDGPYANYNWELFFHIPLTIAVHLSKTQRFAEAQRWFHYIFDPTSRDSTPDPESRFWKFLAFRQKNKLMDIDEVLRLLSTPLAKLSDVDKDRWQKAKNGYNAILDNPGHPHKVAQTRPIAYQYSVVMKYLDNLIAWGDHLFQQDTLESINEATQLYVLAANILGDRPQEVPARGKVKATTFAELKNLGLGLIGDTFVKMEGQFPLDSASLSVGNGQTANQSGPLFGIGRTLYFCLPRNEKLLSYWDTVGDRLFKIRHGMNIEGLVRPLALFDPPIDPGMLVKAAAAGIDIGSIVSGLNQPIGPVRCLTLIQKAWELCGEVRSLGSALLSALEKGDAEHLAVVRQGHEIMLQKMTLDLRFLQWKKVQEDTKSLLTSRATALERLHYYQRLLGLPADPNASDNLTIDQSEKPDDPPKLTQETFDDVYQTLVGQYDVSQKPKELILQKFPPLKLAGDSSPDQQSGASGSGRLYLIPNENAELNEHGPKAQDSRDWASRLDMTASTLASIPGFSIKMHFWGLGGAADIPLGTILSNAARAVSSHFANDAQSEDRAGQNASKTGSLERRADESLLQHNLAAHELTTNLPLRSCAR
jgi:hypothetical protein